MDTSQLYQIFNTGVLPFWLMLMFLPKWKFTNQIIIGVGLILAIAYAVFLPELFKIENGGFNSLQEVMVLFANEKMVLLGWIHYLCFDLLIGRWIAMDAIKKGISQWLVAPCLVFTLMAGPVGFLLYTIIKFVSRKTIE